MIQGICGPTKERVRTKGHSKRVFNRLLFHGGRGTRTGGQKGQLYKKLSLSFYHKILYYTTKHLLVVYTEYEKLL